VETLVRRLPERAVVTGELDEALVRRLTRRDHHVVQGAAAVRRAALLAELAQRRLAAGRTDDPKALVPLYLREPAIGPRR
jgi:tRNA A37 threonylcarbamoyladenosine modification protein TsaB